MSLAGRTRVDERSAIVVKDAGNVPGDAPSTMGVAAAAPMYPQEVRVTGPGRPGGRIDACNDGKGGNETGTLTLVSCTLPHR